MGSLEHFFEEAIKTCRETYKKATDEGLLPPAAKVELRDMIEAAKRGYKVASGKAWVPEVDFPPADESKEDENSHQEAIRKMHSAVQYRT